MFTGLVCGVELACLVAFAGWACLDGTNELVSAATEGELARFPPIAAVCSFKTASASQPNSKT